MIQLGLTNAQQRRLDQLLVTNHTIEIDVQLLDLEHKYLGNMTRRLLGGQVTIDASASEAKRSCSIEVLDPFFEYKLDNDAPDDSSVYATRMIKVIYSVISPDRKDRFDIPIFCGPLSKVERSGVVLALEAKGKESLSMQAVWVSRDFKENTKRTDVIRIALRDYGGEQKYSIPDKPERTANAVSLNAENPVWALCQKMAEGLSMILFYDARGVAQLNETPKGIAYTFRQKGALLTDPQASYNMEDAINAVEVIGKKIKKRTIRARVVAPRSHPLSPWKLGRWNKPRYLPETITDDTITSVAQARRVAQNRLNEVLEVQVEVTFDSLPIPYLEEYDLCRVESDQLRGNFRLLKMTIPLLASGTSTVGYLRRVTPSRRNIAIKNPHKGAGKGNKGKKKRRKK